MGNRSQSSQHNNSRAKGARREGKRTWQRPMYKTKGTGEAKMTRVVSKTEGWTAVGRTAREKLNTLTTRIQGALKEEAGQMKEWEIKPGMQPKNDVIRGLRREAEEIRKLLGNTEGKRMREWLEKEKERCEKITKGKTTSEQITVKMAKDPVMEQVKWVMHKR